MSTGGSKMNVNKSDDNKNKNDNNQNQGQGEKPAVVKGSQGSTRQYLEQTVVNAVMQGMAELAKEKPNNPLEFLGNFLIEKSKEQK